jgi:aspartyl-tRNA(Asn)/glutamyl-tRNA(Gln) amidotransferase subunit A
MTDFAALSVADLTAAYRAGTATPVDALDDALARVERHQASLNILTLLDAAGARAQAEASTKRWHAGEPASLADGVVTTIKSNVATRGWPTRRGSTTLADTPAVDDAPITASLRSAGCVLIGQTTMPEFGWIGVTHSRLHGVTRNPFDPTRTPGGSSGGAAVAAALGIGHFHVGTDGAGSIRIPSSWSGLFGIMPTVGRVPAWPASPFGLLARLGPMTRRVADGALMLSIMARPDARDPFHDGRDAPDFTEALSRGVRGLRLAWSPTLGHVDKLDPKVLAICENVARRLTELGAIIVEADPGFPPELAWRPLITLWNAGCAAILAEIPAEAHPQIDAGFRRCAEEGSRLLAIDVMRAMADRAALHDQMRRFHEGYDALLTPTMPTTAIAAGLDVPANGFFGDRWFDWSPYTWPFNVTGQPAGSVPVGLAPDGMPVGLQIVAAHRREDIVLRVARGVEMLADFRFLDG